MVHTISYESNNAYPYGFVHETDELECPHHGAMNKCIPCIERDAYYFTTNPYMALAYCPQCCEFFAADDTAPNRKETDRVMVGLCYALEKSWKRTNFGPIPDQNLDDDKFDMEISLAPLKKGYWEWDYLRNRTCSFFVEDPFVAEEGFNS